MKAGDGSFIPPQKGQTMRTADKPRYAYQRCALTRNLRRRAQVAEATAEAARMDAEAARAEVDALRAEIRAERTALTAFIDSPERYRDLLALARERVQAELMALTLSHKSCAACGSFGRGLYEGFLRAEIEQITEAEALPPVADAGAISWPVRMGQPTRRGRALDQRWLQTETPRTKPRRETAW